MKPVSILKSVSPAEPFNYKAIGSFGNANNMLLRQYKFPTQYTVEDCLEIADHDRLLSWDHDNFRAACDKYVKSGELEIHRFAFTAKPESIMDFLKEALKVKKTNPNEIWTGFRITVTTNRSNGYPVFTLALFANNSGVPVCGDENGRLTNSYSSY